MNKIIQAILLLAFCICESTALAADTVVVVPLGKKSAAAGQACINGKYVTGFDDQGNIICNYPSKYIFVTSDTYDGKRASQSSLSLEKADSRCQSLADEIPLGGAYKAWLSVNFNPPAVRFAKYPGNYITPTGIVIASGWKDLTDGTLQNPINITEKGDTYNGLVWTNTQTSGYFGGLSSGCADWTSNSAILPPGQAGLSSATNGSWTDHMNSGCHEELALYCVQQ